MEDGMYDWSALWILTVGILYLLTEAWRSHCSCKTWVESYKIFVAIFSVHDWYQVYRIQPICNTLCISCLNSQFCHWELRHQQIRPTLITLDKRISSWPFLCRFAMLIFSYISLHCGWDKWKLSCVIYSLCWTVPLRQRKLHSNETDVWWQRWLWRLVERSQM